MNTTSPRQTERAFQDAIADLARMAGWTVAHFRPARTRNGYRTAVAYDGAGFPDLVLAHRTRGILFIECKTNRGRLTDRQQTWLDQLTAAGAHAAVWRPADWPTIEQTLTGRPSR